MVREVDPDEFRKRLEAKLAAQGQPPPSVPQPPPAETWKKDDLLPDLGGNLSDAAREMDAFIETIDPLTAYRRWINKEVIENQVTRDEVGVSCPIPGHRDANPSAWIRSRDGNGKKRGTWFCGGCQIGGDLHDLAAYHFGYPSPGYKQGEMFGKLRTQMAESFGFRTEKVIGGTISWVEPQAAASPPPVVDADGGEVSNPPVEGETSEAVVSQMWAEDEEPELVIYPTVNWKALIPEDTFIYEYMKACCNDDAPEEYHFWHALMALGLVVGRNVTLDDTQPVYGNILLCILGATGTGKSRSRRHLNHVLREASPYQEDGTRTTGVKQVPVPSSGEYLVHAFAYEGRDPTNNKVSLGMQSVTGIVDFDEMSALLARANRQGSTLKPTLMALCDAVPEVKIGGLQRGDFIAKDPFCSITASTQPKAIRTLLNRTDAGSGFLNRWVFAGGKEKQIEIIGGDRSNIRVDLSTAIEELKKVRGWGALERSITMDDDAYERYSKFFRAKIEPAKTKDETDLLKRIDLITKKLMLLLTINLRKTSVPLQVVEATTVLFDYVLECYGILNSNIGITLMQDVMTEIQRHIQRHTDRTGRGASANDIVRYTKRKNYSLEQIKKALEVMTALDIIQLEPKETGVKGRPTQRYRTAAAS